MAFGFISDRLETGHILNGFGHASDIRHLAACLLRGVWGSGKWEVGSLGLLMTGILVSLPAVQIAISTNTM